MYSDGGRGLPSDYGSFLREKRSQARAAKQVTKSLPAPSVSALIVDNSDNNGVPWRPPGPSFTDSLQLSLGRRVVENGELTVKVLQLESHVAAQSSDYRRKCNEIAVLESTHQFELAQSRAQAEDLRHSLDEAKRQVCLLQSKISVPDEEVPRMAVKISELEELCGSVRAELRRVQEESDTRLQSQAAEFEQELEDVRCAGRGAASFREEQLVDTDFANDIAALQEERNQLHGSLECVKAQLENLRHHRKQCEAREIQNSQQLEDLKKSLDLAEYEKNKLIKLNIDSLTELRNKLSTSMDDVQLWRRTADNLTDEKKRLQTDLMNLVIKHERETQSWEEKLAEIADRSASTANETLNDME
ncbi:hypothetical protein BV898_11119, partial [Hypsibius exemplaris]